MLFLTLRIVFNTAFAQLLKLAQVRDGHMLPAACVNYIVAALLGGLGMLLFPTPAPHALSVALGLATGLAYALSLLGMDLAVRTSGVSIAVAIVQLSVLVPTVVSMVLFRERPGALQSVGMALSVPALWLLTGAPTPAAGEGRAAGKAALPLLLLFLVTGFSGVLMKTFEADCPPGDRLAYATALFAVSALVIGGVVAQRKVPWGRLALPVGTLVGICNLAQLEVTLMALSVLPAIVVFPASSALTVVISALLAAWFWKERLSARTIVGMALAIVCAVLLNAKR